MTLNAAAMVIATTVASESMPSMKFMAFITPTIQNTDATAPRKPRSNTGPAREMKSNWKPKATRMNAAANCTANFCGALVPMRSSYTPRPTIERAAGQDGEEIGEVLRDQVRRARVRREQQQRKAEAEDDGDPAEPRRGHGVDLPLARHIDQADVLRRAPDDGRGHVRGERAADEQKDQRQRRARSSTAAKDSRHHRRGAGSRGIKSSAAQARGLLFCDRRLPLRLSYTMPPHSR